MQEWMIAMLVISIMLIIRDMAKTILAENLPDTEELLMLLEEKADQIQRLTDENQQWQELAQKLNSENRLLQKQNSELLTLNSR